MPLDPQQPRQRISTTHEELAGWVVAISSIYLLRGHVPQRDRGAYLGCEKSCRP